MADETLTAKYYFDNGATTPMEPEVINLMADVMRNHIGNASSQHLFGIDAKNIVEQARRQVATVINAKPEEIVFTSGATEANNIAVKGVANFYKRSGKNHIITQQSEHKCVLESCHYMEQDGCEVTYLPVNRDGLIDLRELEASITERTCLVSIMGVNNETGVIQPLQEIGDICRRHGVYFHSDCAQAFGKIPLDVQKLGLNLMSISGHKIYGPKGVGALYVGQKPHVRLYSPISGGKQERGIRSGTLATFLIAGLGKAAELMVAKHEQDWQKLQKLSDYLIDSMLQLPEVHLNGIRQQRYPGIVNLSFFGVEGEALMLSVPEIAISSGSACTSSNLEGSYVLTAMQTPDELVHTSIRFGMGRFTEESEVEYLVHKLTENVNRLREQSPLWEMFQSGIDLHSIKWTE